jgi:rhodanese-related sulfurtransferase
LRSDEEFATGYIEGATHIAIQQLLADMTVLPAKDAATVLACQSGHRGGIGLLVLSMLGWTNVRNLAGGMNAWTAAELPVVK